VLTRTDEPLARWTTLRLGGAAARFVEVSSRDELYDVVMQADAADEPVLVVGEGSNLVVADSGFAGTAVRVASRGVVVSGDGRSGALVTVEAGESWESLVERAVGGRHPDL